MARKDFDDYYNKITSQFQQLNAVFEDMNREVENGMVEPERIEQLKLTIEPIKTSYHTLTYIKYLLDKPSRKSKHTRYDGQNKKRLELSKGYHSSDYINRNKKILETLNS